MLTRIGGEGSWVVGYGEMGTGVHWGGEVGEEEGGRISRPGWEGRSGEEGVSWRGSESEIEEQIIRER